MSKKTVYWVVAEVNPKNAGYRVRTVPLVQALNNYSVSTVVISIQELVDSVQEIAAKASTVIIAKPSDTALYLCMEYLKSQNIRVLVDVFDNYFCWSPLTYKQGIPWQWLRNIKMSSGVIASTPFIAETLRKLHIPEICLVSDLPTGALKLLSHTGSDLLEKWHNPDQLEILWFGISSNPFYYAGIDDLISWVQVVSHIRNRLNGIKSLRLTICTNNGSVPAIEATLMSFHCEDINARFVEWTEEVCDELLFASHLVLIPTNLSGFSLSKTHNRCSDAISHQCLVLSSPNGPYHDIPGAVYRDVDMLCNDLASMDLARIAAAFNESFACIFETHALTEVGYKLADFVVNRNKLSHKTKPQGFKVGPSILIIGERGGKSIKLSRKLGYLSAGFDGSGININYDFILAAINPEQATVTFRLNAAARQALNENIIKLINTPLTDIQIQEADDEMSVILTLPVLKPVLSYLAELWPISNIHISLKKRLIELNIHIVIISLRHLGFSKFELCTNESGGWNSYLTQGDPKLGESAQNLCQLWLNYQGNELMMGQPLSHDEYSNNCTGAFNDR